MSDLRFGTINKFGTSTTFGASTAFDAFLIWGVEVDWDGDGVFTGENEQAYLCGLRIERGRRNMLQTSGNGFELIQTGKAVITFWNDDGRYDGWNASSPLYPNVTYGKDVKITVRDAVTGTIEPVFYGVISDIVPTGYGADAKVNVHVEDGWATLRNFNGSVALQSTVSIDSAIGLVLDSAGWPARWGSSLDASSDSLNFFWTNGDKNAGSECADLADSVFGNFFINASGQARFLDRATAGTSQGDFDQSELSKEIGNPQPWINYRNVMQLKVHPVEASPTALLYEYFGDVPSVSAGGSLTIWANYTYNGQNVPAQSIISPISGVDYTANSASDGSGTDLTSSVSVTATRMGTRAMLVIANGSGSTAYITLLRLRGVAVYEKAAVDVFYPTNPGTVTNPRSMVMDMPWQQNPNIAADITAIYGPFLAGLHPFPTISLENNFSKQFGIELFDLVTFTSYKLGVTGVAFRVGGIEHETLDDGCQWVKTTFYLEPYVSSGSFGSWPLEFGTSTFGW